MTKTMLALGAAIISLAATGAQAADVLNPGSGAPYVLTATEYTQDFNTLKSVTSDPTPNSFLPAGWQGFESGSGADGLYRFGSSGSNTSGLWSFGSGNERALGAHAATEDSLIRFGAIFQNDLGGAIDSLTINYTGEQWQKGFNRATLVFEYSLDATSIVDGTWTAFTDLDFLAPDATVRTSRFGIVSRNGNTAAYRTALNGVIDGLSIGDGQTFGLRWSVRDIDPAGVSSDDGLGIDDFRLTATLAPAAAVPEPASWAMMIGGFGLVGGTLRRRARTSVRFA